MRATQVIIARALLLGCLAATQAGCGRGAGDGPRELVEPGILQKSGEETKNFYMSQHPERRPG